VTALLNRAVNNFSLNRTVYFKESHTQDTLYAMKSALGDSRYSSYSFLTSALEGGEWSASRPDRILPAGKKPPVPIAGPAANRG
jgi:hypothetical protein